MRRPGERQFAGPFLRRAYLFVKLEAPREWAGQALYVCS
jgi:hypothetical protein